jgi:hypothetical protein
MNPVLLDLIRAAAVAILIPLAVSFAMCAFQLLRDGKDTTP